MRKHSKYALFGLIGVAVGALASLQAATPVLWHVSTQIDLLKGELENVSVDTAGRLTLGPATELVTDSTDPFVWTLVASPSGGFWAGTGNRGQVLAIADDGRSTVHFDAPELEVHALAVASDGSLLVGTAPDGKVHRVPSAGEPSVLFDPDQTYVWAILADAGGEVFVATGEPGAIYRISPDGTSSLFYETKAKHVVSLARDLDGRLLASTQGPGQILRIDGDGRGFTLVDSTHDEVRALTVDAAGILYAAALNGSESAGGAAPAPTSTPPTAPPTPVPMVSTEITAVAVADVSAIAQPAPRPSATPTGSDKAVILRVQPDGAWDVVWQFAEDLPYDLALAGAGDLLVGTGSAGKIYRLHGDPAVATLVTRADAKQVTELARSASGRLVYGTANPGKVFRLTDARSPVGSYVSEVRDAGTVATWGSIRWRGTTPEGTGIELYSRSGNTATPDDTWSEWAGPYQVADGETMTSPKARYLQWKAVLTGRSTTPVLTSVTAAYLPRNLRPSIAAITVHPPGTVFQRPFSGEDEIAGFDLARVDAPAAVRAANANQGGAPALGRREYRKGFQTFVWTADDPDGDRLVFDVLYRREEATDWTPLETDIHDRIFVWETRSVPDGAYVLTVRASDRLANSPETALMGALESAVFSVDNTPPRVEFIASEADGGGMLRFRVRDAQSALERVEVSLAAGPWQAVYPVDGILDSRIEEFAVSLAQLEAGAVAIVRAADLMDNTATATR